MNREDIIHQIIIDILLRLGIPTSVSGLPYITEAIKITLKKPLSLFSATKDVYPEIAKKFNTKSANVERAIRHAIEIAWSKERIIMLNKIFGVEVYRKGEKPGNSEFIALLAEKIPYLVDLKTGYCEMTPR